MSNSNSQNNIIVFDTNALFVESKDKVFDGFDFRESFKKIISFFRENEIQNFDFYVSQITVDEIINQKTRQVETMLREGKRYLDYFAYAPPLPPQNIREMVGSLFRQYEIKILENTYDLDRLYNKVIACDHPFRRCNHATDLGFKDAIIIENILNLLLSNQFRKTLILYTRDNDFDEKKVSEELSRVADFSSFRLIRDEDRLKETATELNLKHIALRNINSEDLFTFFKDQGLDIKAILNSVSGITDQYNDGVLKIVSRIKKNDDLEIDQVFYYDCYNREYIFGMEENDEQQL